LETINYVINGMPLFHNQIGNGTYFIKHLKSILRFLFKLWLCPEGQHKIQKDPLKKTLKVPIFFLM
jgi:hypothetical protein